MTILTEVITACEVYKKNTNETPRFIVIPVSRARILVKELIDLQGDHAPDELLTASVIHDDADFAEFLSGLSLQGIRVMVLIDQLILGGWADECMMRGRQL